MITISFEDALTNKDDRFFSIGNDLIMVDDLSCQELEHTPIQMGFLFIGLCREGEAIVRISGREHNVRKGDLVISLGEQVFEQVSFSDDFHITFVLMSRQFAQDCVVGLNYMWPYLLYVMKTPVFPMSEEEQTWVWNCYNLLRQRAHKAPGRYMREAVISLTRAFYFEICNLLDSRVKPDISKTQSRAYSIFDQFIRLVSQNFKKERSVEWYSNEMCLTPKHLSEVVKGVSGRTAGQWISTMVIIEIKSLLQNSALSIKEITQEMNFPNQSFLGKYFKNIEGVSPTDFRKGGAL